MKKITLQNKEVIINTIKILIYKKFPEIFKKINFNDDNLFLEPLLFSFFNSEKEGINSKETLEEILQGYFIKSEKLKINESFNKNVIAYIPQIGYFKKGEETPFLPIQLIKGTNIEILKYSHPLIDMVFGIASEGKINGENFTVDKDLYQKYIGYLTNAFQFIKTTTYQHFDLIEKSCRKCILFKTDTNNTNSFATINAHGMVFFNVYQEDYDEVFFVDDIAHQTGHIILTTLFFNRKEYFIIDENENIKSKTGKIEEYRSFYILFHALYTYYTSMMCLDKCIENDYFDKRQLHEASGRIGFYLRKLQLDLENFYKVIQFYQGIEFCLTKKGIDLFKSLMNKFGILESKWQSKTQEFNYNNQPYNFTYKEFVKLNPLEDE